MDQWVSRAMQTFDVPDNTNPAGGINSSAEDMAKWIRVQLSGGVLADGSPLFSPATAHQLTTIVTLCHHRRTSASTSRISC